MKESINLSQKQGVKIGINPADFKEIQIFPQYVRPGDLFICLPSKDKALEALKLKLAVENGAKIIVKSKGTVSTLETDIPIYDVEDPRNFVSSISSLVCKDQPPVIIGVTGTCGKTSTAYILRQVFNHLGHRGAFVGSLGVIPCSAEKIILKDVDHTHGKTRIMYEYLKTLFDQGTTHLVQEVTSAALEQRRVDHVNFSACIFTNLSFEHLNYHHTMKNYFAAKARLFSELLPQGGLAIINQEDEYGARILTISKKRHHHIVTFGKNRGDVHLIQQKGYLTLSEVKISVFGKCYEFVLPMPGTFQCFNILPVIACTIAHGEQPSRVLESLERLMPVPGRLELIRTLPNGAQVFVDFAHKPGALETILKDLRQLKKYPGKLLLIFGCDGNADYKKQPLMGEIASKYCDKVYVTDDNPRKADAAEIRRNILKHCPRGIEIPERKKAIETVVRRLGPKDICLVIAKLAVFDTTIPDSRPYFASEEREIINQV